MPRGLGISRRISTAARWPLGVTLTSWRYMWRTTPMHRRELPGSLPKDAPPPLPAEVHRDGVQRPEDGVGALFHRIYRARISDAVLSPVEAMGEIRADPNRAAPREFASFNKVHGEEGEMRVGDEYIVRMPGPWDGPVRVAELTATSVRLVTLEGHLEAGQIEFKSKEDEGTLTFSIESWARSGDRLSNLLYRHLRMAKEVQMHMWTSFLERVIEIAGGRRAGRLEIETRRVDAEVEGGA
jgi:hypothetical protein